MKVIKSNCTIEDFNSASIVDSLITETGGLIDKSTAEAVAYSARFRLAATGMELVPSPLIREMVCGILLEMNKPELREKYIRVGLPVYDVKRMIEQGSNENANLHHNPETVHKFAGDAVLREYAFTQIIPPVATKAHYEGQIHIHDSDYFAVRPNCLQHDLRYFFGTGLMVDGSGKHTSVSRPPKHALTAALHAAKILASSQTNMAGGQSLDNFNVFMAPFITGMTDKEIEQVCQAFVYEMNMQYVARGGQVVFSNMNIETIIPTYLRSQDAVGPKGEIVGTYDDYHEELYRFTKALLGVFIEGDGVGKPHLFPNMIVKVRPESFRPGEARELYDLTHELFAKFGTPYILNLCPEWQRDAVNSMGCRTRLSGDWALQEGHEQDWSTMRCGNMQYVTLNLPRLALDGQMRPETVEDLLMDRLEIIENVLHTKNQVMADRFYDNKVLPFLSQQQKMETYMRFDNMTYGVGFCGLNEYVRLMTGYEYGPEHPDAARVGDSIIEFIRKFTDNLSEKYHMRFTTLQSPAESTAGRFARLDLKKYGDKSIVNGNRAKPESVYYTNSSHMAVDADVPLFSRAKFEGRNHKLLNGGHITHLFMGEAFPIGEGLASLTEKLCKNTGMGLFDYTRDITHCKSCNSVSGGIYDYCPKCHSPSVECYSRITGYCQRIGKGEGRTGGWNPSKMEELKNRRRYRV